VEDLEMKRSKCLIMLMAGLLVFVSQSSYATLTDTPSTIAIWDMDAEDGGYIRDASTLSGITRDLRLDEDRTSYGFTNQASVTTGSAGVDGEALYFPGYAVARSNPFFSSEWEDFTVDFNMKVEAFPGADASYTAYMMVSSGVFQMYMASTNYLSFDVLDSSGGRLNGSSPCQVRIKYREGQWLHVVAGYDKATQSTFMNVYDASETLIGGVTQSVGAALNARDTDLQVGGLIGKPAARSFNGWLDNMQFTSTSVVPEPATIAMLGLGVLMFRKRR
jgi:hypothetical protein